MRLMNQRISRFTRPITAVSNRAASLRQVAGVDRLAEGWRGVFKELGNVGDASVKTGRRLVGVSAAAGGLAWLFKRQFVDTASEFENLALSLEAIEGSAPKAQRAM